MALSLNNKAIFGSLLALTAGKASYTLVQMKRDASKINDNKTKHGGKLVANAFKAYGITHVFTLTGGHISPILVECERSGIKVIDTRHEVTAVYAADAMARLTGKCGIALVTSGPGLTNTITAVENAHLAESPLLLISGAAPLVQHNRGALQDIDHAGLMKTVCKYSKKVLAVRDIVPEIKKAMKIALSGVPGPVFLEIPYDVLYSYEHVKQALVPSPTHLSFPMGNIGVWKRDYQLYDIFHNAWTDNYSYDDFNDKYYAPLKPDIPMYSKCQFKKAERLIAEAKKPILVLGSQVMLPPVSAEEFKEAILKLNMPTFMSGMARGLLSDKDSEQTNKNIQFRFVRKLALKEADLIIIAGLPVDFRMSFGRGLNQNAKIIAVNRSNDTLTMNSDIYWKPTLKVHSDCASFLTDLSKSEKVTSREFNLEFNSMLRKAELEEKQKLAKKVNDAQNIESYGKVNPLVFLSKLNEKIEQVRARDNKDIIIIADGGDFIGTAAKFVWPTKPLQWLDPGLFGTLGVGGGFALAAKLVANENNRNADVWLLYGDGTAGYSIAEVDTFVRHKLQVNICIGNDSCWAQVCRQQKPLFDGSDVACPLEDRHYEVVGAGYGGKGLLIGACKPEEGEEEDKKNEETNFTQYVIEQKITEFFDMKDKFANRPTIMNVMIDGGSIEKFRKTAKYI
ncbi:thiamine diphosphate-binding protein [Neocallimastix lanati (nom. inval.)]|jgi:acetolactate synthase-like protein|uniref:Thiamin diphosphate-binding protein n=1 Tax=Neocallimastix californiae TaxID=1754190 RepID=A0A1Y2DBX6_9FUNG|nr:thiamine diphosphate-binding protein [Neocallimastix sp. JGI-2020a]ORY56773.1 Thiamin diphosphate-binding protein [Neocallimastix californiae]|eukprot:ORY56773.1 Thiamin diphosphate-binding protein [Neocallimastix californiae]